MVRPLELPDDIESLKQLVLESIEAAEAARAALIIEQLKVEKLRFEIARFKRSRYGRSSEQLAQLELSIEDLEASHAALPAALQAPASVPASKPVRKGLPTTLPREEIVHAVACTCTTCGGPLRPAGEDVAEMLEWIPARYKVIRHIRPKFACERCEILVQAPAPTRPIARGLAGPGLLAHVLVSKFADHLPLYRQSQIFARDGIDLERSTLADWVGGASALLSPLVEALGQYVLSADKVHADDTPVPVLCPGRGSTRQARLWTYVRDDRPCGSADPPAVFYRYSPDRKGERPREHLSAYRGILQADAYAGFEALYGERIQEAACWAHCPEPRFMRGASCVTAEIVRELRSMTPDNNGGPIRWNQGKPADRAWATRDVRGWAKGRSVPRNARVHRASSASWCSRSGWWSRCWHGRGNHGSRLYRLQLATRPPRSCVAACAA